MTLLARLAGIAWPLIAGTAIGLYLGWRALAGRGMA